MTVRLRTWLAAAAGLWMTPALGADEPARHSLPSGQAAAARVRPSYNQQVADTIADHLRQSGHLRCYRVHVVFQDGVAELTGQVADQPQRDEAVRIAQGVPGVARVRDRLTVTGRVTQVQAVEPPTLQEPRPASPAPPAPPAPPATDAPPPAPPGEVPLPPPNPAAEPVPLYQAAPSPYDLNPPKMPAYAWPTYAPYNNYSRVAYPTLYPYQAWPFIGPIYPFPKVPLGWRKVKLEWQDGKWWYSTHSNSYDWWRLRYW